MPTSTPTRDRILDAAHDLVLTHGFSATTVDAILEVAHASKGAFFHHFPSKQALGQALVERYARGDRELLDRFLHEAEARTADPAAQLVELLRAFEVAAADTLAPAQPGCLFVSFVYEQVHDTAEIRPLIVAAIEHWRSRIAAKLDLAAAAGRLPAGVDTEGVADHVFTTFEGAFILARATGDAGHLPRQLAQLRRYVELLLGVTAEDTAQDAAQNTAQDVAERHLRPAARRTSVR